jgi:21S rRNA (GM2251-2'-O)-methyltransferase
VILVLDEIHDPQNLGAILRSAHFLGCTAVVVSDRNSAPLSPAVSRASVGALEVMVANVRSGEVVRALRWVLRGLCAARTN